MLTLFVAGQSPRSTAALVNLQRLCQGLEAEYEVVDVLEDPGRAETDQILATPTLLMRKPEPARRVIGDLSDVPAVAAALGLPVPPAPEQP